MMSHAKPYSVACIDFDETLFHTEDLKKSLLSVVAVYGVTAEDFWSTIASAENQGRGATYYDYTFEKHISRLKNKGYDIPSSAIKQLEQQVQRSAEFVFPDAQVFLEHIRLHAERIVLLSSGNRGFQLKKINASGLNDKFDDIIIIHDHKETMVDYLTGQGEKKALFVNDNLLENIRITEVLPSVQVLSKINPIKFAVAEYQKSIIPAFTTLTELQEWLEKNT